MALQGRCAVLPFGKFRLKSSATARLVALTPNGYQNAKCQPLPTRSSNCCNLLSQSSGYHTHTCLPVRIDSLSQLSNTYFYRSDCLFSARSSISLGSATANFRSPYSKMATLETLNFDNTALRSLPVDPIEENVPRKVTGACFSLVKPTPVKNPEVVVVSIPALSLLDLPEDEIQKKEFEEYFSGNKILPGAQTASHCYCGHQFGNFAGQLGDGAAM